MNTDQPTIDVTPEPEPQTQALAVREAHAVGAALPPEQIKVTPAQAKIEAVANLTFKAYERASTLALTTEESKALQAEFPDDAFRTGAAGKEDLIYIEHAHLRDRLNQVFGLGQWSIIPRNRWSEEYEYYDKFSKQTKKASRVYVEAMLLVRGAFVAEAIGDMTYYPGNASTNFGDAVEGAKTAALRRCAKELGVGLQAWKREFCEGWKARQRSGNRPPPPTRSAAPPPAAASQPQPSRQPPAPVAAASHQTTPPVSTATPAHGATDRTRAWALGILQGGEGGQNRRLVHEYMVACGWLLPNETPEDLPLRWVPTSKAELGQLSAAIDAFHSGAEAKAPYAAHEPAPAAKPKKAAAAPAPAAAAEDEPWRAFPMPFGKQAGTPLGELDKKYLFGLWANYTVETEYNGKPKKAETISKDRQFRAILDQAGTHYGFEKKD